MVDVVSKDKDAHEFVLVEVHLDKGVSERVMANNERPWEISVNARRVCTYFTFKSNFSILPNKYPCRDICPSWCCNPNYILNIPVLIYQRLKCYLYSEVTFHASRKIWENTTLSFLQYVN